MLPITVRRPGARASNIGYEYLDWHGFPPAKTPPDILQDARRLDPASGRRRRTEDEI